MATYLRLVPDKPVPLVRKPPPRLTPEQRERLALALDGLHRAYGTWYALAAEMGMSIDALKKVRVGKTGSMATVVRAAELAGVSVERLLTGGIVEAGRCPHCGR